MMASRCLVSVTVLWVALTLQGCRPFDQEVKETSDQMRQAEIQASEAEQAQDCQEHCKSSSDYGRWRSNSYGHGCWQVDLEGKRRQWCQCSSSPDPPECCEGGKPKMDLSKVQKVAFLETEGDSAAARNDYSKAVAPVAMAQKPVVEAPVQKHSFMEVEAVAESGGSPSKTVNDFCDVGGLKEMHGANVEKEQGEQGQSAANQLETAILGDIAKELESNNVDKMAKEIFTFYVCVRWIPDETFWQIARQELAADLVQSIVDHKENIEQAVAELYQNYKFVPLLCSKNLEVFGQTSDVDHTYFTRFKEEAKGLATWLAKSAQSRVGDRLRKIDEVFCGSDQMNSKTCEASLQMTEWMNGVTRLFGYRQDTKSDKWDILESLFKSFDNDKKDDADWRANLADWKSHFPFHSFIDKPEGMPVADSPMASERFLVCFGKRVGSEMHRRPNGQHILTDQNNIGCHGWWEAEEAGQMIDRMVELWKPPTCQMADMVYTMKREILSMFKKMNERLFDALPTLLMDEELTSNNMLSDVMAGPGPYNPNAMTVGNRGTEFVEGMRVAAKQKIKYPKGCSDNLLSDAPPCELKVQVGIMGTAKPVNGKLFVAWDTDGSQSVRLVDDVDEVIQIMPHGWKSPKGMRGHLKDLVAGLGNVRDKANQLFSSMFRKKYTGLSTMMSDSVSKWIVCPVRQDADLEQLDNHLGVEDAAFQDFRKEAYAKWTGYEKEVPGEKCEKAGFLEGEAFADSQACEISELHADHVEKYFLEDGTQDQFICPMKPPLPFDEQLSVLAEKKKTCFMRMTDEQARHYSWVYQGKHPNRKQNEQKANTPIPEFELVKLLKVSEGTEDNEVAFGRYCSLEELHSAPRFCAAPHLQSPWPTVDEMADHLASAVQGSLGVGAAALQGAIATYQKGLNNGTDRAKKVALKLSEKTLDNLFGAGRLLRSTAQVAVGTLADTLPGRKRFANALDQQIFGRSEGGELLHRLSYQHSIGTNGRTSNAKERFQRYIVTVPCGDFDPALNFATRKEWGDIARRLVQQAMQHLPKILQDGSSLEVNLRGEARHFLRTNQEAENATWWSYGASMQIPEAVSAEIKCSGNAWSCSPSDRCKWSTWNMQCMPRAEFDVKNWWAVDDTKLKSPVGGAPISAGQQKLSNLRGIKLSLHCGEKRAFPAEGPPQVQDSESLLECLRRGVSQNARMRAKEPWKLFFPEEVVAVAMFSDIQERYCQGVFLDDGSEEEATLKSTICTLGAIETPGLDQHLTKSAKSSRLGVYRGFHTGAGFANGTPREIVLRPEDILEAAGLLTDWATASVEEDEDGPSLQAKELLEPTPGEPTEYMVEENADTAHPDVLTEAPADVEVEEERNQPLLQEEDVTE